jgi:hypothetical protein
MLGDEGSLAESSPEPDEDVEEEGRIRKKGGEEEDKIKREEGEGLIISSNHDAGLANNSSSSELLRKSRRLSGAPLLRHSSSEINNNNNNNNVYEDDNELQIKTSPRRNFMNQQQQERSVSNTHTVDPILLHRRRLARSRFMQALQFISILEERLFPIIPILLHSKTSSDVSCAIAVCGCLHRFRIEEPTPETGASGGVDNKISIRNNTVTGVGVPSGGFISSSVSKLVWSGDVNAKDSCVNYFREALGLERKEIKEGVKESKEKKTLVRFENLPQQSLTTTNPLNTTANIIRLCLSVPSSSFSTLFSPLHISTAASKDHLLKVIPGLVSPPPSFFLSLESVFHILARNGEIAVEVVGMRI